MLLLGPSKIGGNDVDYGSKMMILISWLAFAIWGTSIDISSNVIWTKAVDSFTHMNMKTGKILYVSLCNTSVKMKWHLSYLHPSVGHWNKISLSEIAMLEKIAEFKWKKERNNISTLCHNTVQWLSRKWMWRFILNKFNFVFTAFHLFACLVDKGWPWQPTNNWNWRPIKGENEQKCFCSFVLFLFHIFMAKMFCLLLMTCGTTSLVSILVTINDWRKNSTKGSVWQHKAQQEKSHCVFKLMRCWSLCEIFVIFFSVKKQK